MSIILPDSPAMFKEHNIELLPDQKRSGAAILVGLEAAAETTAAQLFFNVTLMDSKCDNAYVMKPFIDAMFPESSAAAGAHVIFGPSCEYCIGERARANYTLSGRYCDRRGATNYYEISGGSWPPIDVSQEMNILVGWLGWEVEVNIPALSPPSSFARVNHAQLT